MAPPRAASNGNGGMWRWVAAIVGALLIGLTPYLLTSNSQKDYAQKDDLAALSAELNALSERVARNEEQVATVTDATSALLEFAQNGETRLSDIESVLARIEAILNVEPAATP